MLRQYHVAATAKAAIAAIPQVQEPDRPVAAGPEEDGQDGGRPDAGDERDGHRPRQEHQPDRDAAGDRPAARCRPSLRSSAIDRAGEEGGGGQGEDVLAGVEKTPGGGDDDRGEGTEPRPREPLADPVGGEGEDAPGSRQVPRSPAACPR